MPPVVQPVSVHTQTDDEHGVNVWVATYPDQGPFGTLGVLAEAYACVIMSEEHTVGNLF